MLLRIFPFLEWLKIYNLVKLRADAIAGLTVALVLIPQSMAYAQLAGLPAYYGLYAAFLPGIVAALWGSSGQLATGPVAVVSLLTASALAPLAAGGSLALLAQAHPRAGQGAPRNPPGPQSRGVPARDRGPLGRALDDGVLAVGREEAFEVPGVIELYLPHHDGFGTRCSVAHLLTLPSGGSSSASVPFGITQ